MNVLVTGHAGYIGSVLVEMLTDAGYTVTGLDSGFFAACGFPPGPGPQREIVKDMRDVTSSDVRDIDAIIHLAALCNDPLGDLDPSLTADINHRASVRLATLARDAGVRRFIFASSCSMYGAGGSGDELLTEEAPLRPLTPYAESKVRTEEDLSRLADSDFTPVFLRNATAYGFSPRLRADIVLNNLVGWAHTTGKIRLNSDGKAWRPIVHVQDIGRACIACLEAPIASIHNEAINIGCDQENYQVRQLAEIVRETVPGSTVEFAGGAVSDPRNYRVDFSKARRILPEFEPLWTARQGAEELYHAYRTYAVDRDTLFGPRFTRLLRIRELLQKGELTAQLRWSLTPVAS
jgi:nucleoside-diphosphate-sugar epimerase